MSQPSTVPARFIGLDIHKEYFVAAGVDHRQRTVLEPQRAPVSQMENWIKKRLTRDDAVVLEMTTNTYRFYDALLPQAQSVTVVHPPHVALVTRAQVKTDRKAAIGLAQLLAAGLLVGIWVPPKEVREVRALLAQRSKMVRLQTQAKNRLHSILHRLHILPPEGELFTQHNRTWWAELPLAPLERVLLENDLDTLAFARSQIDRLTVCLGQLAARDERVPLLVQLPGVGLLNAMTILAAVGPIERFPTARHLVGYAGLGARVHDSGKTHQNGRITKAGRRDLRSAMVEIAHHATRCNGHWKGAFERMEKHLGSKKAMVAVARKLLVAVWHVLAKGIADRFAEPQKVACSLFAMAYRVGVASLPAGQSPLAFTRAQLDRLGLGAEVTHIPWGSKRFRLPASIEVSNDSAGRVQPLQPGIAVQAERAGGSARTPTADSSARQVKRGSVPGSDHGSTPQFTPLTETPPHKGGKQEALARVRCDRPA